MFKGEYQGGPFVEVLSGQGRDPISKKCRVTGNTTSIQKQYDKDVKSYVYILDGEPTTTKIQIPKDDKQTLFLIQGFLVLQLFVPTGRPFSLELGVSVTDQAQNKRRIFFSSSQKEITVTSLHAKFPLSVLCFGTWLNLCFDLNSLVGETFSGQTFRALESVTVTANCRLRKIFTLKTPPVDNSSDDVTPYPQTEPLPRTLKLTTTSDKRVVTQILSYQVLAWKPAAEDPINCPSSARSTHNDAGTPRQDAETHIAFGQKVVIPEHIRKTTTKDGQETTGGAGKLSARGTRLANSKVKLGNSASELRTAEIMEKGNKQNETPAKVVKDQNPVNGSPVVMQPRPPKTSSAGKGRRAVRVKPSTNGSAKTRSESLGQNDTDKKLSDINFSTNGTQVDTSKKKAGSFNDGTQNISRPRIGSGKSRSENLRQSDLDKRDKDLSDVKSRSEEPLRTSKAKTAGNSFDNDPQNIDKPVRNGSSGDWSQNLKQSGMDKELSDVKSRNEVQVDSSKKNAFDSNNTQNTARPIRNGSAKSRSENLRQSGMDRELSDITLLSTNTAQPGVTKTDEGPRNKNRPRIESDRSRSENFRQSDADGELSDIISLLSAKSQLIDEPKTDSIEKYPESTKECSLSRDSETIQNNAFVDEELVPRQGKSEPARPDVVVGVIDEDSIKESMESGIMCPEVKTSVRYDDTGYQVQDSCSKTDSGYYGVDLNNNNNDDNNHHELLLNNDDIINYKNNASPQNNNMKSFNKESNEDSESRLDTNAGSRSNIANNAYNNDVDHNSEFPAKNKDSVSEGGKGAERPRRLPLATDNAVFTFASAPRSPRSGKRKFFPSPATPAASAEGGQIAAVHGEVEGEVPEVKVSLTPEEAPEGEMSDHAQRTRGALLEDDFYKLSDDEAGEDDDSIQKLLQSSLSPRHSPQHPEHQLRQSIRSSLLKEIPSPAQLNGYDAQNYASEAHLPAAELNQSTASSWRFDMSGSTGSSFGNQSQQLEDSLNISHGKLFNAMTVNGMLSDEDDRRSDCSDDTSFSTWRDPPQDIRIHKYQNEMKHPGHEPDLTATISIDSGEHCKVFSPTLMTGGTKATDPVSPQAKSPYHLQSPGKWQHEEFEEELDLLYDPCLNCYFDPKTHKYYELA